MKPSAPVERYSIGPRWAALALAIGIASSLAACASAPEPAHLVPSRLSYAKPPPARPSIVREEVGLASWYGDAYNGRRTASGERFDMDAVSAAHPSLPMVSLVEVTNLENGRSIRVRVNDRSPRHPGRVIDLSRGAADQLGFLRQGLARVRLRYLGPAGYAPSAVASLQPPPRRESLDLDAIARDPGGEDDAQR